MLRGLLAPHPPPKFSEHLQRLSLRFPKFAEGGAARVRLRELQFRLTVAPAPILFGYISREPEPSSS